MKYAIPIVLASLAGILNYLALNQQTPYVELSFLKAKDEIKAGALFNDSSTEAFVMQLPEDVAKAMKSVGVPAADKSILANNPAPRPILKGELILWRDAVTPPQDLMAERGEKVLPVSLEGLTVEPGLLKVGRNVGFLVNREADLLRPDRTDPDPEYLGPFRLLSIGTTLSADAFAYTRSDVAREGNRRIVSVAVRVDGNRLDRASRSLLAALSAARDGQRRIVAILLDPAERSSEPPETRPTPSKAESKKR